MGPWALAQAKAFQAAGMEVKVISLTSYVPKLLRKLPRAESFASCPRSACLEGVHVNYPRWPFYQVGIFRVISYRWPMLPLMLGWQFVRGELIKACKEWQPTVIYAHHSCVNGFIATRLARVVGLPVVVTDHDFLEVTDCRRFPHRKRVMEIVAREAHLLVAVAARMAKDIQAIFPGARTSTVQNGTDAIPVEISGRARPEAIARKLVVFSAGIFYERKGFPLLIDAFARVAEKHPTAILRIAGDGPERARIEDAIRTHKLHDRIVLLGLLPHRSVLQELAWCDVFALVGWDEPFATVFIEAAAAGKPIILARDGGFMDVLEPDVHGLAVEPRSVSAAAGAIDRLLSDEGLRVKMGQQSEILWRQRLTWEANASQYAGIFLEGERAARSESVCAGGSGEKPRRGDGYRD